MLKTKEKVCLTLFLFGILMISSLMFFGCKPGNLFCYFVSEDEIVLMTNSSLNTKQIKIESNTQYNISWDKNIIDYNSETGEIMAKSEGKTKLTITYKKDGKELSQSISVVVLTPVFATDIELEENYVYYVGSTNNTLNCDVLTQSGKEYNLDILCESENPLCFQTDKNVIIPQTVGSAKVLVRAVSGYDEASKQFLYVQKEAMVHILTPIRNLSLTICDKNYVELAHGEQYDLFYDGKNMGTDFEDADYILKIVGDANICYYEIQKANENQLWDICKVSNAQTPENTKYVAIKLTGTGNSFVSVKLLRQGEEQVFVSVALGICNHRYINENDIKLYSSSLYKTAGELKGNIDSSFETLLKNNETGKYDLYKITDNADYFSLALQNKKYFYGIICFDNFDANCYNEINAESSNMQLEKLLNNRFSFKTQQSGPASITFSATSIDGKVFEKTIEFSVTNVSATSFSRVISSNVLLELHEEMDFMVTNVVPAYANVSFGLELKSNNGVLEIRGTKVVAKSYGDETLVMTVDGQIFEYSVSVLKTEPEITVQVAEKLSLPNYYVELEVVETIISIQNVEVMENVVAICQIVGSIIIISSTESFSTIRIMIETTIDEFKLVQISIDWAGA